MPGSQSPSRALTTPSSSTSRLARFRAALSASPPLWWALLYFFCLLCGYYVLRPVRDAMGASSDPATVFPAWLLDWSAQRGYISIADDAAKTSYGRSYGHWWLRPSAFEFCAPSAA